MARPLTVLVLLAGLVGWYEAAPHVDRLSLWPAIVLIAFVLIPASFLLVWLLLPLWSSRLLLPAGIVLVALAVGLSKLGAPVAANFCKLGALTVLGWWFLTFFEDVSWVVLVALIVPVVDTYSVWRGPTHTIVHHHADVFNAASVAFTVPGGGAFHLGLPDVLFFALFLAAAARWRLRLPWTWLALTGSFVLTLVLAISTNAYGLPALPLLAAGFLLPNADLLWTRLRARTRTK